MNAGQLSELWKRPNPPTNQQRNYPSLFHAMKLSTQKSLALKILEWHSGQSSPTYAMGSCMLADSNAGRVYIPGNHRGHADGAEEAGAVTRAIYELRGLRKNANYPEAVMPAMEREANALANRLARHFQPAMFRKS